MQDIGKFDILIVEYIVNGQQPFSQRFLVKTTSTIFLFSYQAKSIIIIIIIIIIINLK